MTCGSETAGMIRDVYVCDNVFAGTNVGFRFKTRRPRGGGGENLYYERNRIRASKEAISFDMLGSAMYVGGLSAREPMEVIASPQRSETSSFETLSSRTVPGSCALQASPSHRLAMSPSSA